MPAKRSAALGVIALIIVLLATAGVCIAGWFAGTEMAALVSALGKVSVTEADINPTTRPIAERMSTMFVVFAIASVVGLVGWILAIVATVRRSGRPAAVTGIVIGALGLFIGLGAFYAAVYPTLAQYAG